VRHNRANESGRTGPGADPDDQEGWRVGLAWGLVAAVVCALAYGSATVFQAIGATRTKDTAGAGVDPRVLIRALSQLPFVAGLGLDVLGLVADLVALEKLPLFAVQAIMNCSLAVTALLAVPLLKAKLTRSDWIAVGAVVLGLILVGVSAGAESPVHVGRAVHWALLAAVVVLIAGSFFAIWKLGGNPVVLAAFAGSLFGAFAICVRILPDLHPTVLLTDPAAYAGVVASITGFLFFTTALQRGSVTMATATLVVGETGLPALLGFTLFHDHTRHGFVPVAVVGFLSAVGGAVALSRFGEAEAQANGGDQGAGAASGSSAAS
jgi:drug/metabolite transporter (DMT)-like permease